MKEFSSTNFIKNKKIFLIIFLIIFIFLFFSVQFLSAEEKTPVEESGKKIEFHSQVKIPALDDVIEVTGQTIGKYIGAFYQWFVVFLAVLAVIMIMIAGLRWIFAAGNPQAIKQSQDQFFAALIGLLLILIAVPMLQLINPALVNFGALDIPGIRRGNPLGDNYQPPFKVWLVPYQFSPFVLSGVSLGEKLIMYDNLPAATHFCLHGNPASVRGSFEHEFKDERFCYYNDFVPSDRRLNAVDYTGSCVNIGGARAIVFALFFQGKVDVKNVAVQGLWGETKGVINRFDRLCNIKHANTIGCGDGKDGWTIRSYHKDIGEEVCKKNGFESGVCSVVVGSNNSIIRWYDDRIKERSFAKTKGEFEIEIDVWSRNEKFLPVSAKTSYNQTCGIIDNCKKDNTICCRKKISFDALNYPNRFYYDFDCPSPGSGCPSLGDGWERVADFAKDLCGLP